ncbi:MAG: hypothetical protein WDO13_05740 [Verrucomicrobiota bacterium]
MGLRDRIRHHAEKVRKQEEMEAALAGVFDEEAQAARERFLTLVQEVIKPSFHEFKATLRDYGRDAVIVLSPPHALVQSIGLTLVDRYLNFGVGKTVRLVNLRDDLGKSPKTKFYEIFAVDGILHIRQRADTGQDPVTALVEHRQVTAGFLESELISFFERAYPTGGAAA